MKTLKITTDNKISIIDLDFDHKSLREEVGGYVEAVHTGIMREYFKAPVLMLVDEEGLLKRLPINTVKLVPDCSRIRTEYDAGEKIEPVSK